MLLTSYKGNGQNLPLLQRAGNNGSPCVHAAMCDNTCSDICMMIHSDSCFNLVKSVNRYRLHMTVCRTTRAYHGTMATKGLFITCPSANVIGIKAKVILQVNDSGIAKLNNSGTVRRSVVGKSGLELVRLYIRYSRNDMMLAPLYQLC